MKNACANDINLSICVEENMFNIDIYYFVQRKFDSMASPAKTITSPLSPQRSPASHANGNIGGSNSKMVVMPVSTAMTTAKWLRTVISPLPSKP